MRGFSFMKSLLILTTSFLITFSVQAASKLGAILQGIDGVFTDQETIVVKAKLESSRVIPYRMDIPGEIVQFHLNGKKLGDALTDGDGVAELEIPAKEVGQYLVVASLPGESEYQSNEAEVVTLVLSRNTPIAISDIDHTISDASPWEVLVKPNSKLKPLQKAASSIKYFSNKFQILYLTARDDAFINKTKEWLAMYDFVKAPILFWDFANGDVPSDHGDFKSWIIEKMKEKFDNILIGFGDKPHDIRAYRDHGLRSYYIGKQGEVIHPDGIKVPSWDKIIEHFNANPIGSLSTDPQVL
jgi:hypothetical protein